ncbi:MAG: response regulator [Bdellovibrionales bacterium]
MSYGHLNILVADDSGISKKILERFLMKLGVEYYLAEDGNDAIAEISTNKYHIAFLDIVMPDIGGLDIVRACQKGDLKTKFYGITANSEDIKEKECLEAGFVALLLKPMTKEKVEKAIIQSLSFSSLGPVKSEEIESIMNYFDSDLDFLTKTYELASRKIIPKKISEIKSALEKKTLWTWLPRLILLKILLFTLVIRKH